MSGTPNSRLEAAGSAATERTHAESDRRPNDVRNRIASGSSGLGVSTTTDAGATLTLAPQAAVGARSTMARIANRRCTPVDWPPELRGPVYSRGISRRLRCWTVAPAGRLAPAIGPVAANVLEDANPPEAGQLVEEERRGVLDEDAGHGAQLHHRIRVVVGAGDLGQAAGGWLTGRRTNAHTGRQWACRQAERADGSSR